MATLKHINSKNADYGAAEQYLLFEHDEFTMKPVLDETGRLIPREDYRLSTLNCDGEDFAVACMRANLRYGKNQQREDVKSHHYEGATVEMSIRENVVQASLKKLHPAGIINVGREKKATKEFIDKLRIATPTTEKKVRFLSGGTQQKVILAKWLCSECEVLILDEPTRGIDVGAKEEIYHIMDDLTHQGVGILMVSSDMSEVLGMSDRIYVMREGEIVKELSRDEADQELVLSYAMGKGEEYIHAKNIADQ